MRHLIADPNSRVRPIATITLLAREEVDAHAIIVLVETLADPSLRVSEAALALFESLGRRGVVVLESLLRGNGLEPESTPGDETDAAAVVQESGSGGYLQWLSTGASPGRSGVIALPCPFPATPPSLPRDIR